MSVKGFLREKGMQVGTALRSRSDGLDLFQGAACGGPAGDGPDTTAPLALLARVREKPAAEHPGRIRAHQSAEKLLAHSPTCLS